MVDTDQFLAKVETENRFKITIGGYGWFLCDGEKIKSTKFEKMFNMKTKALKLELIECLTSLEDSETIKLYQKELA